MRGRTISVLFFIAMLSVFAADFTMGCGQGYVYGPVSQKFTHNTDDVDARIAINNTPYNVPLTFYGQVQVGDTVKYDGRSWSIVKRANSPAPASTPP